MIIGNPDKFAIYIDIVKDWCYPNHSAEGVFGYIIKNTLLPENAYDISCTLGVYLGDLNCVLRVSTKQHLENKEIYELKTIEAYEKLNNIRYGIEIEQDFKYSLLVGEMIDDCNEIYHIISGEYEKIFYQPKKSTKPLCIELQEGTVYSVINETINWLDDTLHKDLYG